MRNVESSAEGPETPGLWEHLFALGRPLSLGKTPQEGGLSENEQEPTTAKPFEALEVPKNKSRLTQGNGIQAPVARAPEVNLSVTPETYAMLERLHKAGVLNLGQTVLQIDEKLTSWDYDDVLKHMIAVQGLRRKKLNGRDSTALCRLRYLRFMEQHPVAPVQLRPPSEESWREHVAYRMQEEENPFAALNQERKALKSFLAALDLNWPSLDTSFEEIPPHWTLPPDELIPRFWETTYYPDDPYMNATIQHVFHFGFWAGIRPPSELCALNLADLELAQRNVWVTEIKKNGKRRELGPLEPFVATASNGKSLKHYVEYVRPKVARPDSEALFLNAKGNRFHPNDLGPRLSECGKRVWPAFTPYTMRRWCATTRLIDTGFNVYHAAEWLGDTVATVERHYIEKARARSAMRERFQARRRRLKHA